MTWNLRVVMLSDYQGDLYFELREVFYNDEGIPVGHTRATVGGDTIDEMEEYLDRAKEALAKPTMRGGDFTGSFKNQLDDEWN
jgi:hypothetical protein